MDYNKINIRRKTGSVVYLTTALSIDIDNLYKIGSTKNEESRKANYKSSGNRADWNGKKNDWDKVEELSSHVFYQESAAPESKIKKVDQEKKNSKKIIDYFNFDKKLEADFKKLELEDLYKGLLSGIIDYDKPFEFIVGDTKLSKLLGRMGSFIDLKDLNTWLRSENRTKKSVCLWRCIIYSFGNDFDSIENYVNKYKNVSYIFDYLSNKLKNLSNFLYRLCNGNELNFRIMKNLYISYCATMEEDLREEIYNDMLEVLRS